MSSQLTGYVRTFQHQCSWFMQVTYVNPDTLKAETVEISYPLCVDYTITKNIEANTNTAVFRIHNLNPKTRSYLYQERFNVGIKKTVKFCAGYNGDEKECFVGYVMEGYSERQGSEVITTLDCWDIGISEKITALTFNKGTTFKDAYKHVVSLMPDVELGAIGELNGEFKTETTFIGTPFEILNKLTNCHSFIDNGEVTTLQNNECLDVPVYQINAENGLLGTPLRRGGQLLVTAIFQPQIKIGQLYEIKSGIASQFDGVFKVCGFTHTGTISGAIAGQRRTQINLLVGALLPNSNYVYTGNVEKGFKKVKKEEVTEVNQIYGANVEEVYRYLRDTKGKILNKKISPNISWAEMIGNENTDSERYNELTKSILYNCETVALGLQKYRDLYYPQCKLQINSGWRCNRVNSKYGGATGIHGHLYGNAIDFSVIGVNDLTVWKSSLNNYWHNHFGFSLVHKNHIHIQNDRAGK